MPKGSRALPATRPGLNVFEEVAPSQSELLYHYRASQKPITWNSRVFRTALTFLPQAQHANRPRKAMSNAAKGPLKKNHAGNQPASEEKEKRRRRRTTRTRGRYRDSKNKREMSGQKMGKRTSFSRVRSVLFSRLRSFEGRRGTRVPTGASSGGFVAERRTRSTPNEEMHHYQSRPSGDSHHLLL